MSNRIIKDTIAITVITLVAGLALGVVQDITADPIAKQEAQAKQDAYKAVFADADSFETVDVDADAMQSYLDENGYAAQSIDETMLQYLPVSLPNVRTLFLLIMQLRICNRYIHMPFFLLH